MHSQCSHCPPVLLLWALLAGCSSSSTSSNDSNVLPAETGPPPADGATVDSQKAGGGPDASPAACFSSTGRSFSHHQVADIGGAPIYPELMLDPDGRPVAAFRLGTDSARWAAVARFDGSGWSPPEPVTQQVNTFLGKRPALAIEADGTLHVASYATDLQQLQVAVRPPGGAWTASQPYDGASDAGDHAALALDPHGGLHLTFLEYGSYRLIYGRLQAGAWSFEPVTDGGAPVKASSSALAVDAGGSVHVVYFTGKHLHYARREQGSWSVEIVDQQSDKTGHTPDLALDAQGNPVAVYLDWSEPTEVRLARRSPTGSWSVETVDSGLGISYTTAIQLGPCGGALIAYGRNLGQGPQGLWLAHRPDAQSPWTRLNAEAQSYVSGIDMALAPSGALHLIYLDESSYLLRHALLQ